MDQRNSPLLLVSRKGLAIAKLDGRTLAVYFLHVPILNTAT